MASKDKQNIFGFLSKLPGYASIEEHSIPNKDTTQNILIFPVMKITVISLTLIFALSFLTIRLIDFLAWPPKIYNAPQTYNLTKEHVIWDVHYGPTLGCNEDSCYIDPKTPSNFFKRHEILPMSEFPIKQWQKGEKLYYRTSLKIPTRVLGEDPSIPISLHTILMFSTNWDLYINGQLTFQGTEETMLAPIPRSLIRADGSIDLAIIANVGNLPFQGISNRGEMVIGRRADLAPLSFFARDTKTSNYLMYLLPKLTFCLVFSILFLFLKNQKELIWFLIYGFTSSAQLYFFSDYSKELGLHGELTETFALIARNYSLLALAQFITSFYRLNIRKIRIALISSVVVLTIFSLIGLSTLDYDTNTKILDVTTIILKPCVFAYCVYISLLMTGILSKEPQARVRTKVALACSALLIVGSMIAAIDLFKLIGNTMGYNILVTIVNLSAVFDLVFFVFIALVTGLELAIQHVQQKELSNKLSNLNERLELASTVQTTLLPEPMHARGKLIHYDCFYISAERLAGDWLFVGEEQGETKKFILGDVTGKGPAAALAVSAILSHLRTKDPQIASLPELLADLNQHLFHLFRGQASTSLCAVSIHSSGETEIVSNGMTGWLHISKTGIKILTTRGSILGIAKETQQTKITCLLSPGDRLIAFSDGCLEGQRQLRKLVQDFQAFNWNTVTPEEIFQKVLQTGQDHVLPDDKALIHIQKSA